MISDRRDSGQAEPAAAAGPGAATPSGVEPAPLPEELVEIRRSIDNIDAALVHLLAERFNHTQRVGRLKARHGLPPADPARERVQIERLRSLAAGARLDPDFAEKFLNFLVEEVIHHHRAIAREEAREGATGTTEAASGPAAQ